MTDINLGNISLKIDIEKTRALYTDAGTFVCTCRDCQNYLSKIDVVRQSLQGLDAQLGIDISKDVGVGMDELMPGDEDDHLLYVIPYYLIGTCAENGHELPAGSFARVHHIVDNSVSLLFVENSNMSGLADGERALTMWIEFRTPMIT